MSKHKSDSTEQRSAESKMLELLENEIGANFSSSSSLPIDLGVVPDGIDLDKQIVVEAYARIGGAKGGQKQKIKGDVLKLAYIDKCLPDWNKIMLFACSKTAGDLLGQSWVANAAREFGIETYVVDLPEGLKETVVQAQSRQEMINA